jgi:ankyrin repeat protein
MRKRMNRRVQIVVAAYVALGCWSLSLTAQAPARPEEPRLLETVMPLTQAVLKHDLRGLSDLLAAGQDPNAKDENGATPWMWAITFHDNEALALLLDRVKAIRSDDVIAQRRLVMAASLNNLFAVRQLLARGAAIDVRAVNGDTAFLVAASSGRTELMRLLLDKGADPGVVDQHRDTALMAATRAGAIDAVRMILARHVDPNAADDAGRSALMWAARSGRADVVRLLLESGSAIERADRNGWRAIDHAAAKRHDVVVALLEKKGAKGPGAAPIVPAPSARAAVERSLPLLQRGAQTWNERRGCGSCHHRQMIVRTTGLAKRLGFSIDSSLADAQLTPMVSNPVRNLPRLRRQLETDEGVAASTIGLGGDGAYADAGNLIAQVEADVPKSEALEVRAQLLARKQMADGRWRYGPPRVPVISSDFTTTAYAVLAITTYGPADASSEIGRRVDLARRWLLQTKPETTDDKASRLLGLRWTGADRGAVDAAVRFLTREQRSDGGWSQLPGLNSDAYATGMVLVALHTAGAMPVTDPVYRRGVNYLLATQEPDGSWFVHKRAAPLNDYFESGFPHGKFQFISYAGSCWATMALMYAAVPDDHTAVRAGLD